MVEVARASLKQAQRQREVLVAAGTTAAEVLRNELSEIGELVEGVIEQTRRRVFKGEQVAAQEKLVSIFEEHTQIIRRGKSGKAIEFGRKVWLSEVEGGIISDYTVSWRATLKTKARSYLAWRRTSASSGGRRDSWLGTGQNAF